MPKSKSKESLRDCFSLEFESQRPNPEILWQEMIVPLGQARDNFPLPFCSAPWGYFFPKINIGNKNNGMVYLKPYSLQILMEVAWFYLWFYPWIILSKPVVLLITYLFISSPCLFVCFLFPGQGSQIGLWGWSAVFVKRQWRKREEKVSITNLFCQPLCILHTLFNLILSKALWGS